MAGFIYIMSNPAFKDGVIKIGKTDRDPSARSFELYTTGVPDSFNVEYYAFVEDPHSLEQRVHKTLDELRLNNAREFFTCPVPVAIHKIRVLASSSLKFEQVFYRDKTEVEREKQRQEQEQNIERKRSETLDSINTIDSLKGQLRGVVRKEMERLHKIYNAKSLYDKLLSGKNYGEYSDRLQAKLQRYIDDVVDILRIDAASGKINKHQTRVKCHESERALINLTRIRLAEYYAEISEGGDYKYWGLVKGGKIDGPAVIIWEGGEVEQGVFFRGSREGEFIIRRKDGKTFLSTYQSDRCLDSTYIEDFTLRFHQDQEDSRYSVLMRS